LFFTKKTSNYIRVILNYRKPKTHYLRDYFVTLTEPKILNLRNYFVTVTEPKILDLRDKIVIVTVLRK